MNSNNIILISRTFATITPESSEQGDFDDHGFISEREEVTFTELVDLMREHIHASSSGDVNTDVWFSTGFYTSDYRTGEEREESIHFHRENAPNVAKYWKLAHKFATKK
jgi:hypothetical protein